MARSGRLSGVATLGVLLASCSVKLAVPTSTVVTCTADSACPSGFLCAGEVQQCRATAQQDGQPPQLLSAVAEAPTSVLLSFDKAISPRTAADPLLITVQGLRVIGTAITGQAQILVTTATQLGGETYAVTATVRDEFGNEGLVMGTFVGFGTTANRDAPTALAPRDGERMLSESIQLAWTPRVGATSYSLEIAIDPDFTSPVSGSPFITSDTTFDWPVGERVSYYWRVRSDIQGETTSVGSVFHSIDDALYVYCAAGTICTTGGAGNRSNPLRSVAEAVDVASSLGLHTVRVASRENAAIYLEPSITIQRELTLLGGYDSTFAERNATLHVTTIEGASPLTVQVVNPEGNVAIDGFELRGSQTIGDGTALFVVDCRDRFTLRDSHLIGGTVEGGETYAAVFRSSTTGPGCAPLLENNYIEGGANSDATFGSSFGIFSYNVSLTLRGGKVHGGGAPIATAISVSGGSVLGEDVEEIVGVTSPGGFQGFGVQAKARDTAVVSTAALITLRRVAFLAGSNTAVRALATAVSAEVAELVIEDCPDVRSGEVVNDGSGARATVTGIVATATPLTVRRSLVRASVVTSDGSVSTGGSAISMTGGVDPNGYDLVVEDATIRADGIDMPSAGTSVNNALSISNAVNATITGSTFITGGPSGVTGVRKAGLEVSTAISGSIRGTILDNDFLLGDAVSNSRGVMLRTTKAGDSIRFARNRVIMQDASTKASTNVSQIDEPPQLGVSCGPCSGVIEQNEIVMEGTAAQSVALRLQFDVVSDPPDNVVNVINNIVVAGDVGQETVGAFNSHSVAFLVKGNGGPVPRVRASNNLFVAGGGTGTTPTLSSPVRLVQATTGSAAVVDLTNNLLISLPSGVGGENIISTCLDAGNLAAATNTLGALPQSLRNNAFVDCNARKAFAPGDVTHATLGAMESALTNAEGNLSFATATGLDFANLAERDFALTASSPVALRSEGLNTSADVCGDLGVESCGAVTTDFLGVARTCTAPASCFSIGPYEAP